MAADELLVIKSEYERVASVLEKIADILFPKVCPICGKVPKGKEDVCADCSQDIKVIDEAICVKCGKPLITNEYIYCMECTKKKHFFEKGISLFEYSEKIQKSLYRFKYNNAREYADFYAKKAAEIYGKTFRTWGIDVIIPIPMYKNKEVRRGYNQAEVFARAAAKYTKIPLDAKCLIRQKSTLPQKELSDEMRRINLDRAFAVDVFRASRYKTVLLTDDIYTTGSTIDACAKLLLKTGVQKVYFLCISTKKDELSG